MPNRSAKNERLTGKGTMPDCTCPYNRSAGTEIKGLFMLFKSIGP